MIKVYFEWGQYAVCIAHIVNEEVYETILPSLLKLADSYNATLTESIEEEGELWESISINGIM